MADLKQLIIEEGDSFEGEYEDILYKGVRSKALQSWCGYILIPIGYVDNTTLETLCEMYFHCGVTFGPVCIDDYIKIGFDCAHSGDLTPTSFFRYGEEFSFELDVYRPKEYVKAILEEVAMQLCSIKIKNIEEYAEDFVSLFL